MQNYKIIKTKDLKTETIYDCDMDNIKNLSKFLTVKYTILSRIIYPLFLIVLTCFFTSLLLLFFEGFSIKEFISLLFYSFLIYMYHFFRKTKKRIKKFDPKKSQYGIVNKKYLKVYTNDSNKATDDLYMDVSFTNNNESVDNLYIDVFFPNDSTIIKKIKPSIIDYFGLKEGDSVLVISYDNIKSFCIVSKNNK